MNPQASDDDQLFRTLYELCLELPEASQGELELSISDTEEDRELVAEARQFAAISLQLRAESTLPVPHDLAARFQERLRLFQEGNLPGAKEQWQNMPDLAPEDSSETPLSDLFDWIEGNLSEEEAAIFESRLAISPEVRDAVPETSKLVGILSWMRDQSLLEPESKSKRQFDQKVAQELDQQIRRIPPVQPMMTTLPQPRMPELQPAGTAAQTARDLTRSPWPHHVWTAARWIIAAVVILGLGLGSVLNFWQPTPGYFVMAEVQEVRSVSQLRGFEAQLNQAVGELLLQIDDRPENEQLVEDLANTQLLQDLAERGDSPEDLELARFLAKKIRSDVFKRLELLSASEQPRVPATMPWESTAYGKSEVSPTSLKNAIAEQDFAKVIELTKQQSQTKYQLLRIWALLSNDEAKQAHKLADQLSKKNKRGYLSSAPLVYLAGVYRELAQPARSIQLFRQVKKKFPTLGFHLGQLYLLELNDAEKASEQFATLQQQEQTGFTEYAMYSLEHAPEVNSLVGQIEFEEWQEVTVHPQAPTQTEVRFEGDKGHRRWIGQADELTTGEIVYGRSDWADYQVKLDFRIEPGETPSLRDPMVAVLGYYQSHEEHYRLLLDQQGIAFESHSPSQLGGFEAIRWDEVSHPLDIGRWYRVKFRLLHTVEGIQLAAKIWPSDTVEPDSWQISEVDLDGTNYIGGKIGLSVIDGEASFRNIHVDQLRLNP